MYVKYLHKTLIFCFPGKFVKIIIQLSQETNMRERREPNILNICEYFTNTSCLTNTIPIPKFWTLQTIPVPICTEVGSANLFLILFATQITIHGTLPCTAMYCMHCTALNYTALHCTFLRCIALHCTTLCCTVLHWTGLEGNIPA